MFPMAPSNIIALLFLVGLVCLLIPCYQRIGGRIIITASMIFLVIGSGPVSHWLMGKLEYRYPKLGGKINDNSVTSIVILAGYGEEQPATPRGIWLNAASVLRLVECARIFRENTDREVLICGAGVVPEYMKIILIDLGVLSEKFMLVSESNSTGASARDLKAALGEKRFFLVTSAGHMPRAIHEFSKAGLDAMPAPTHFLSRQNIFATGYLPSPAHLEISDLAIREYAALLWMLITPG